MIRIPGVALTAALAGIGHPLEGGREGRILGRVHRGSPSVLSHTDCPRWTPPLISPCVRDVVRVGGTVGTGSIHRWSLTTPTPKSITGSRSGGDASPHSSNREAGGRPNAWAVVPAPRSG